LFIRLGLSIKGGANLVTKLESQRLDFLEKTLELIPFWIAVGEHLD